MDNTVTFYIVRHGKTLMNTLEHVQGWCDSPLTEEGKEVAAFLGAGMKGIEFESAYSSDLRRTSTTAKIILTELGQTNLQITEMEEFREACFGRYESRPNMKMWYDASLYLHYTDPERMYKDVLEKKISNSDILNAVAELDNLGLAENFEKVEARTHKGLRTIAEKEVRKGKDVNILLVSHGMSITCMLQNMGGRELMKTHLDNASVCKVTYKDGRFTVNSMGDMSFVEQGRKIKHQDQTK